LYGDLNISFSNSVPKVNELAEKMYQG